MKPPPSTNKALVEQLRLLYSGSQIPVVVSLLISIVLTWSYWGQTNHSLLLYWLAGVAALTVIRLISFRLFLRQELATSNPARWHKVFILGTYLSACFWGVAAFLIFPDIDPVQQAIFVVLIAGLAAGAIASLCPSWPAISGFLIITLVPLAFRFVGLDHPNAPIMGIIVLLFLATVLEGARRVHINIIENINLRLEADDRERTLKASEERYRHIFTNAPLGIVHYNAEGVIVDCNDVLVEIIGSSREVLIGLRLFGALRDNAMRQAIQRSLDVGEGFYEGDYASVTSNKVSPIRVYLRAVRSPDNQVLGGVGIVEDFTERRLSQEQVRYYSRYDALTGLPNRRSLIEVMGRELSRAGRHTRNGALLFIDIDNFKNINESLGHSAGDELLRMMAERITRGLRKEDTTARMGGDEFVIILPDLDDRLDEAAKLSQVVAEKLCESLAQPFYVQQHELHVTASIGISLFPNRGMSVDDLLKQADTAMHKAKAAGRNTIQFFLPSMQKAADKRLKMNTELRKALACGELEAFYQPQALCDGSIIGAEVLLRWMHPERGMISPGDFISVAEESGIIKEIGKWVLGTACGKIREWADSGLLAPRQTIAVNVSPREFSADEFVDQILATLRETGANPHQLDIELTEGSLILDFEKTIEKIKDLRRLGIKFSVDDFGMGYSSLSYLKKLPLNTLKIDRSFVSDIVSDPNDAAIVETIILMANHLEMSVIAEGVETEQQLTYLNAKGCGAFQGYYIGRPMPAEQFESLLRLERAHQGKPLPVAVNQGVP